MLENYRYYKNSINIFKTQKKFSEFTFFHYVRKIIRQNLDGNKNYNKYINLSEEERFELSNVLPLPVFKTGAFSHSATPPDITKITYFNRKWKNDFHT